MTSKKTKNDPLEDRKSLIESLYLVLQNVVRPVAYLEIQEQKETLDVRMLDSRGNLSISNQGARATSINMLDMYIASIFFDDFSPLTVGLTGLGKTYMINNLLETLFGNEGYYYLRLSGGIVGSNPIAPYIKSEIIEGRIVFHIDEEKIKRYGGIILDELSRGLADETLAILDCRVSINGDRKELVLEYVDGEGQTRYKQVARFAAMNPADNLHVLATQLDAAVQARLITLHMPNATSEMGSSLMNLSQVQMDLHMQLMQLLNDRGIDTKNWMQSYARITDSSNFSELINGECKEFFDIACQLYQDGPKEMHARNIGIIKSAKVKPKFELLEEKIAGRYLEGIDELRNKMRFKQIPREIVQIENISRAIAFIKGVKDESYRSAVSLNDLCVGYGIMLSGKCDSPQEVVNFFPSLSELRKQYDKLKALVESPSSKGEYGVRETIIAAAIEAGTNKGYEAFLENLDINIEKLNRDYTDSLQSIMVSRLVSDLVVFRHFVARNETEIGKILLSVQDAEEAQKYICEVYIRKGSQEAIYNNRLDTLLR
ncbi:MAG: hypothetical protein ABIJ34_09050 [archaeon]